MPPPTGDGRLDSSATDNADLADEIRRETVEDARLVTRVAAPIIALGLGIELVSHILIWTPDFLWLPGFGIALCLGMSMAAWFWPDWPARPSLWILAVSTLILVSVVQHLQAGAYIPVAFVLIMTTIGFAAVYMPVWPMLISAGVSWVLLVVTLLVYLDYPAMLIFPVPLLALVVASLLFLSRRNSIVQSVRSNRAERVLFEERARLELQAKHTDFAATITRGLSHNLSNQLQVSLLAVEGALMQLEANAPSQRLLRQASDAGERAKSLLLKLQTYTGFGVRAPVEVDVRALCEAALVERGPGLTEVQLECPAGVLLMADSDQLVAALTELIENADSAVAARAPAIAEIVLTVSVRGDTDLVIELADNGPGFGEELLSSATEPFVTSDAPSRIGLGLSFADGVVRQHGGFLSMRNREPFGAVVSLEFPNVLGRPYEL